MAQTPPPNDPFLANGGDLTDNGQEDDLRSGAPMISAKPSRVLFVLGGAGAFFVVILLLLFGGGGKEKIEGDKRAAISNMQGQNMAPPVVPMEIPPPQITMPPPSPPISPPTVDVPVLETDSATEEQRLQRIRSEMLAVNKGQGLFADDSPEDAQQARDAFASTDPNLGFANRAIAASEAPKVKAGFLGDLSAIIAQGKLIHAVLETAIDTTLPGSLRAIVSRDIYAEQTRNILIPKGSRLIGVYNTGILRGQDRVFIIWTRVIRPDGIDIYVNSPGVDNLGRAGLEGYLDQKYKEIFTGAILTSVIAIGAAAAADSISGGQDVQTTTNTDGSSTSSGDPTSFATLNAVGNISNVGRSVVDGLLDLRPNITVDQGTKVNVFVNRDLYFPPSLTNRTLMP
ncbi:MAG: TrbI/VirB10 family protein [Rickettsiales bacterium]|nr:TrbI/VirB10 family protein [Rickettsiales bacterium]